MQFGLAYSSYYDRALHQQRWGAFFDAVPGYNLAPVPPEGVRAMRDLGMTVINRTLWVHDICPEENVYTPQRFDQNVEAILDADMQLFVNIASLPAWMTGGRPAWMVSRFGCERWADPQDGSKGLRWATEDEAPYCYPPNIPTPNADALYDLGRYLGRRYGGRGIAWAPFNEPDEIKSGNIMLRESQDAAIRLYYYKIAAPLSAGLREADPNALIAGPEAAYADGLRRCLELESEASEAYSYPYEPPRYDIVSEHLYSVDTGETLAGAEKRVRQSIPIHERHRGRRELWCTEIQGKDACRRCHQPDESIQHIESHAYEPWNWGAQWMRNRSEEGRYAVGLFYFTERGSARIWRDWNAGDYELTPYGQEMREIINYAPRKRRAVRSSEEVSDGKED